MTVLISGPEPGAPKIDLALLRRRALRALRAIERADAELSIALVDDAAIAELNARYRDKPGPTDVLSFSQLEGDDAPGDGGLLGDVVISLDTARRQARERRRGIDGEVARLLVHGLLHLVGYDHEQDEEARVMEALERRVRRAIDA